MSELQDITTRFGKTYRTAKSSGKDLAKIQQELFVAFDEALADNRARQGVMVPDGDDVEVFVTRNHPGWLVESVKDGAVVLVENPSLLSYTYINSDDGMVYGRDAYEESPAFDDEALREEDPELWERISEWPESLRSLIQGALEKYISDRYNDIDGMVDEYLSEINVPRIVTHPEKWSDEDMALAQPYFIPGAIKTRLRPPRKAKQEELTTDTEV